MTCRDLAMRGYFVHVQWARNGSVAVVLCDEGNLRSVTRSDGNAITGWDPGGDLAKAMEQVVGQIGR